MADPKKKDCLEDFVVEDVGQNCEEIDIDAGVVDYCYYSLEAHIASIPMPVTTTDKSYAGAVTIDTAIEMLPGKYFAKIDLQIDLNELKSTIIGNPGNQKINSNYDAFIAGMTAKLVGMQVKMLNKKVVFIIPDNNGSHWLLGTKTRPARITQFDITTGKTDEDNAGATLNILAKKNLYKYNGAIPLAAVAPAP